MGLLENPGQKLKGVTQAAFIIGIVVIIIATVLCLAAVSQSYYGASGLEILVVIVAAAILFLALWVETLFISAYADMAAQLKRQTEILERIESRLSEAKAGSATSSTSL